MVRFSFSALLFSGHPGEQKATPKSVSGELECIFGGTRRDSGERSERTHRAESRLGEPRKQNGGERRARPSNSGSVPKRKRGRKGEPHSICDNHKLATASSWFHSGVRSSRVADPFKHG